MKTHHRFIGGQYVDPVDGKWIESMDPYRGEAWVHVKIYRFTGTYDLRRASISVPDLLNSRRLRFGKSARTLSGIDALRSTKDVSPD